MAQARAGRGAEESPGTTALTGRRSVPTPARTFPDGGSPEDCADWLELAALEQRPRAAALGLLLEALRSSPSSADAAASDGPGRGRWAEARAEDAFAELHDRLRACPRGYPFRLDGDLLEAVRTIERTPYLFLLLLSAFGASAGPAGVDGASLFEEVCAAAGASYLGGRRAGARSLVFGAPRRGSPAGFRAAVDHLCESVGEGGGCRERMRLRHQRDAKLDVVVWRPFPDRRAGQVVGFGQCATGRGWTEKLHELQPRAFSALWLREPLTAEPFRLFFVPFRVDRARWEEASFYGGVLFDRCRIVAHTGELEADVRERCQAWSRHVLRTHLKR